MDIVAVKAALTAHYSTEDYKIIVKRIETHEVKTRVTPYRRTIAAFVSVGVEARRANGENWKGQARKCHPDEAEVIAILRNAGFAANLHASSPTAQMIGIPE